MENDATVPDELSVIEVRFRLSTGRLVWWKAMVEVSRQYKRTTASLREGVLMYRAAYNQGKERHQVRFLPGNLLVHKNNPKMDPTQWRREPSSSDLSDPVELDDVSFIRTAKVTEEGERMRKSRRLSESGASCGDLALRKAVSSEVHLATADLRKKWNSYRNGLVR